MEFSRQEYWSELPFLIPGNLPNPSIKPMFLASPALAGGFFTTVPLGSPHNDGNKENKRRYLAREKPTEGHCGMLPPPFNVPSCAPAEEGLSIVPRLSKPLLDALHCLTFNVSSAFLPLLSSLWPLLSLTILLQPSYIPTQLVPA